MSEMAIKNHLASRTLPAPVFHPNALTIIEKRYLRRDAQGQVVEDAQGMLMRVAANIAAIDATYYGSTAAEAGVLAEDFYTLMAQGAFLPNSPTLMNAGTPMQQLAACFVLPIDDDMGEIFESLKNTALVHKSGGGTGFSFSRLRAKNDLVASTGGEASGPISFMRIFNAATEEVKQGGKRRGANMGILRVDHPDILDFIVCKDGQEQLNNFNISVAITDDFMAAVSAGTAYDLYKPQTMTPVGTLDARLVFDKIVHQAWKNGEPGVVFLDVINRDNPTPQLGVIESTNPCGEQPLLPYESCNLGSINLERFVKDDEMDYTALGKAVKMAVHFLDNVIDANNYPIPQIAEITRANRKIGLGVMGWANALIRLNIPYNSDAGVAKAGEVMGFIQDQAKAASIDLGKKRGSFANFAGSVYDRPDAPPMRNATVTTIAPTGTISMIANTSSGIEPLFGVVYESLRADTSFLELNALFAEIAQREGFWREGLAEEILAAGTLKGVPGVPELVQKVFATSGEISADYHIRMQAAFQAHCDNAVSKTINYANAATEQDIRHAYLLAYALGCKGLTVYRDGSRSLQVLNKGAKVEQATAIWPPTSFIHPAQRPPVMAGVSSNHKSACSNFYVTVNGQGGHPFEVFCNSVGQGGCQAQIAAVATLTTLLLRSGVAVEEITRRLTRIQCPACIRREGIDVASCPAAVGQAIEVYLQQQMAGDVGQEQLVITFQGADGHQVAQDTCPDCGSALTHMEGCRACVNPRCSYTKCG